MLIRREDSYLVSLLLLVATYLVIQISTVGVPEFGGSSEAREAQVIDVMRRTGEFVLPLRNGIVPSKPPLFHWVGYGLSVFAPTLSEFSARLPSVLFACGLLLCVGLTCRRLAELLERENSACEVRASTIIAPVILALTYGFHIMATQAMVDMSYAFFTFRSGTLVYRPAFISGRGPLLLAFGLWSGSESGAYWGSSPLIACVWRWDLPVGVAVCVRYACASGFWVERLSPPLGLVLGGVSTGRRGISREATLL